jgi:hypothetical protein
MYFQFNQFFNSQLAQEMGKPFKLSLYRVCCLAPVPTGFNIFCYAKQQTRVTTIGSTGRQDIS